MIYLNNVGLSFGKRRLFDDVNIKFEKGNCYGLIGANGAGKSTFLKLLSGELDTTKGEITITKGERISVLEQNHNKYNDHTVLETVIMGNQVLYKIIQEKNEIYSKAELSDEDGMRVAMLEADFAELNGWQAEADAATLLSGLGVNNELHNLLMSELKDTDKVKVLLAKALFGEPDILLLDEPTNGLDITAKMWLEEFLIDFENTIIVVSHDRHFLNKICTHIVDIDYEKITQYVGNYDFWYESSQLVKKQMMESNKKKEQKIKELQDFIARFSANASKSKQATSRKKALDKIVLDEIKPSTRKYPYINFDFEKFLGKEAISVLGVSKTVDGKEVLKNIRFTVNPGDKIAFIGNNEIAKTTLFKIIAGDMEADSGFVKIGTTVNMSYFAKNHDEYFKEDLNLLDWLRQYSEDKTETFVRGFLGRMLFSGEEVFKKVNVLSGGEKVRCMLSKLMLQKGNVLILDEPTNHLDMESITSLDAGMQNFKGVILFATHDHQMCQNVANRIIEITDDGKLIDKWMTYDEYLELKQNGKL